MKTRQILLLAVAILVITQQGCKTIQPEKPEENYLPFTRPPTPSFVQLPIGLDAVQIEQILNENIQGLIYEDLDEQGDNMMARVWKLGDIRVGLEANTIHWQIPMKVWMKAGYNVRRLGITFKDMREFNAEILLRFKTRLQPDAGWNFRTITEIEGYEWLKAPTMKLMGFDLPVKALADYLMKSGLASLGSQVDEAIAGQINLRRNMEEAWLLIQEPVRLSENPPAWLSIQPDQLFLGMPTGLNNRLELKAGISAYIYASVGGKPPDLPPKLLPTLQLNIPEENLSHIHARLEITHQAAENISNETLKGRKFEKDGRTITIQGVKIYGSDGWLAVETEVSGSIRGKLYFKGKPYYDTLTNAIRVSNLKFDIKTRNLLHKSASWIMGTNIERTLQRELIFNLEDQTRQLRETISEFLTGYTPSKGFKIEGQLTNIRISQIFMTDHSLVAYLTFTGNVALKYTGPPH
jgi:hypothetical protein